MIVQTALPLVAERGAAVTTAEIARAAGIGEGTIFRVFADKDELLDACVVETLRPDNLIAQLADIPLDQPLAARLSDAAAAMQAHADRMGAVMGSLWSSGRQRQRPSRDDQRARAAGEADRNVAVTQARDALAELFEPDKDSLRWPPERLATAFQRLLFTGSRWRALSGEQEPATADLIDLFLHGALSDREHREDGT